MKKERIRVGLPQTVFSCGVAFVVVLWLTLGDFVMIMVAFDLTLQDLPLSYYLAVIAQVAAGGYFAWQYCFKSMRDIITFSENGITQRHRAEVVAEIGWNDLMEVGIKWKQFAHSIPGWELLPDRRCYIVYFSDHRLGQEERACLGQKNHQDEAASGIIYHTDMDFRTECRILEEKTMPNPYITKYVSPQCPAFSDLCAAFAFESSIGQCTYVSRDGVVQKMDSLQVPAARRQYKKEKWCGILIGYGYALLIIAPYMVLLLRELAR